MHQTVAAVLRAVKKSGLSDRAVCQKAEVALVTLTFWRRHNTVPSVESLAAVADVVGLRVVVVPKGRPS